MEKYPNVEDPPQPSTHTSHSTHPALAAAHISLCSPLSNLKKWVKLYEGVQLSSTMKQYSDAIW